MMTFTVDWCPDCEAHFIRCPKCGNNCCNGGYGTTEDGKECDVCPLAYQYQALMDQGVDWYLDHVFNPREVRSLAIKLIEHEVDMACEAAYEHRNEINEAVNWGDLSCHGVEFIVDGGGREYYRALIEEAAPCSQELIQFVENYLVEIGNIDDIEVVTEW